MQHPHWLTNDVGPIWLELGIVWAWTALFIGLTILCTSGWRSYIGGGVHLVPREHVVPNKSLQPKDEESQAGSDNSGTMQIEVTLKAKPNGSDTSDKSLLSNASVFTWKNFSYTVKTPSGDRKLLDNVSGWVKPGMLWGSHGKQRRGQNNIHGCPSLAQNRGNHHRLSSS